MRFFYCFLSGLLFVAPSFAQGKPVAEMARQIASLRAERAITLNHDPVGGSSRLMLVAENFTNDDADRAKVMAMNFACGFFFAGAELGRSPETMMLTLWVKTRAPRFASANELSFVVGGESLEIGPARYSAKADRQMEYLNYEVPRPVLERIASNSRVTLRVGGREFQMTRGQLESLANLLLVSEVGSGK